MSSTTSASSSFVHDSGFRALMSEQLQQYLQRIGVDSSHTLPTPTISLLTKVVARHCRSIPFENARLLLLKIPILLGVDDLFQELVVNRRGGYCFQLNTLLLSALRALGFSAYAGIARSSKWINEELQYPGMSHSVLFVTINAKVYLVDTGFSANGLVSPIELTDGAEINCIADERHKVVKGTLTDSLTTGWFLKHHRAEGQGCADGSDADGWETQYYFTTEPLMVGDYRVLNYYTSNYPSYIFNVHLVSVLIKDYGRVTLRNRMFHRRHHDTEQCESRTIETADEMVELLKEEFNIELSDAEVKVLGPKLFY